MTLRTILVVGAVAAAIWLAYLLERIILVLLLAMFLAYVVGPLVELAQAPLWIRGHPRRLPRAAAIVVVYLFLAGSVSAGAALLWPRATQQLNVAIANGPGYLESFRAWERGWIRSYARLGIPVELRHGIDQSLAEVGDAVLTYAQRSLVALAGGLAEIPLLVLVPVLAFFLLKDAAVLRRTALKALPHRHQLRVHRLFEELNRTLAAYVRAQLIACVIVGCLCGIGFAALGHPYAVLLGVLAGVLEFIPLVGPIVVAVVAVTLAALHTPLLAVWVAVFLLVLRMVQDYVIYPRLIGRDIELHPLVVILAVLAGLELGGVAGIFLAIPVVALITVVVRHWLEWRSADGEVLPTVVASSAAQVSE
jgi:predicted PurR-regulated permease PerM